MVDSGAGGCDIMLPQKAIEALQLDRYAAQRATDLRGVGGDKAPRMQVKAIEMPAFQISGRKYQNISCLLVRRDGFDLR